MKKIMSIMLAMAMMFSVAVMPLSADGGASEKIISKNYNISYLVKDDGTLWSYGKGRLGDGAKSGEQKEPVQILDNVRSVSANYNGGLAVKKDDTLWGWGYFFGNIFGGKKTYSQLSGPAKIMDDVLVAASGGKSIAVVKKDHSLWVCGFVGTGQLDKEGNASYAKGKVGFQKVADNVKYVAADGTQNYGEGTVIFYIKDDNSLWGYGYNKYGAVGTGNNMGDRPEKNDIATPVKVLDNVKFVTTSRKMTLAITENNDLYAWGDCKIPAEDGKVSASAKPRKIASNVRNCAIDYAKKTVWIVKYDNTLWTHNRRIDNVKRDKVNELYKYADDVKDVAASEGNIMVVKTDGTIWTSGRRYLGLGFDSKDDKDEFNKYRYLEKIADGASTVKYSWIDKGASTKPQDKPEEKPQDKPEEKPQDKPEEKPQDKPEEKPQDKPQDTSDEVQPTADHQVAVEPQEKFDEISVLNGVAGVTFNITLIKDFGFRIYRSENEKELGISITDFCLNDIIYTDVNVEADTTYYYSAKKVLKEADENGNKEVLSDVLAKWTITTPKNMGSAYTSGKDRSVIMLKKDDPYMSINGVKVEVDPGRGTAPIVINGRTVVPIRAIVEAMGGKISWDGSTKTVTIEANGNKVAMQINNKAFTVNGENKELDVAPLVKDGRTFVPLRFAAQNLGCQIEWIKSSKSIVIIWNR